MKVHGTQDLTKQWGVRVYTDDGAIIVHYFDTEVEALDLIETSSDAELASRPTL